MYRNCELARICDINSDTLRFYEKNALLTRPVAQRIWLSPFNTEKDKDTLHLILELKRRWNITWPTIRELTPP